MEKKNNNKATQKQPQKSYLATLTESGKALMSAVKTFDAKKIDTLETFEAFNETASKLDKLTNLCRARILYNFKTAKKYESKYATWSAFASQINGISKATIDALATAGEYVNEHGNGDTLNKHVNYDVFDVEPSKVKEGAPEGFEFMDSAFYTYIPENKQVHVEFDHVGTYCFSALALIVSRIRAVKGEAVRVPKNAKKEDREQARKKLVELVNAELLEITKANIVSPYMSDSALREVLKAHYTDSNGGNGNGNGNGNGGNGNGNGNGDNGNVDEVTLKMSADSAKAIITDLCKLELADGTPLAMLLKELQEMIEHLNK